MSERKSDRRQTFDVVIVGGGGAGLAAAIEARAAGAQVLLVEKNAKPGGSTAWSIGSITASGTPHQQRRGVADTSAEHWADMPLFAPEIAHRDKDELRRVLCDELPETFRWLLDRGIRFFGPMPEPPHRAPRMHNVLPNSRSYIYHLERCARRSGVVFRTRTRARQLLVEDGRVIGIECEHAGERTRYEALGGVVLAAGDFTNSPELKRRYIGDSASRVEGVNPTATGDGQSMALQLGARILNGDLALGPELRFIAPERQTLVRRLPPWAAVAMFMQWSLDHMPDWLLRPFVMSFLTTALAPSPALFQQGAVLVNRLGKRFTDELTEPAPAVSAQPDGHAYIVFDRRLAELFSAWPNFVSTAPGVAYAYMDDYRRNRRDIFTTAPTFDALGARLGMPEGGLAMTIEDYNAKAGNRPPVAQPPFYALGPVRAVFVHNEGGLAVDAGHHVLGEGDEPIAGLFAVGATGQGGLLLKGHGHHLAWAFVSGRRAGRLAAADAATRR